MLCSLSWNKPYLRSTINDGLMVMFLVDPQIVGIQAKVAVLGYIKLVIGKQIVNIVSAYAAQVGLSGADEKDDYWDSFIIALSEILRQESIFMGSDMNGDGYGGGMGFDTRNADGEFSDAVGMVVCNTFFQKEYSKLITYQSEDNRSMSDYLMVRKRYSEGYFK